MRISHNIPALQTAASLTKTGKKLDKAVRAMTTGYKINSAKDDAASMAIANKLRTQARGLQTASQNALDGISLIQTAEGALNEIQNMLQRIRELCVQASHGIYNAAVSDNPANPVSAYNPNVKGELPYEIADSDKKKMYLEIEQLMLEITDTANKTEFNKIKVLSGELLNISSDDFYGIDTNGFRSKGLILQIGPNKTMEMDVSLGKVTASSLAVFLDPVTKQPYVDPITGETFGLDRRILFRAIDPYNPPPWIPFPDFKYINNINDWDPSPPAAGWTPEDPASHAATDPDYDAISADWKTWEKWVLSCGVDLSISRSISVAEEAIADISEIRAYLGAVQNRLEHTVLSLDNNAQNTEESRSRIEDTDMAYESIIYSSANIVSQAAIAILAQANQRPQQILQLLR